MSGYTRVIARIYISGLPKPIEVETSDVKFNDFCERVRTSQRAQNHEYINLYDESGNNPTKFSPMLIAVMWSNKK